MPCLQFDDFSGKVKTGAYAMSTITLELPDELAAVAEKQGLLSPLALEAYIQKSQHTTDAETVHHQAQALRDLFGCCKGSGDTLDAYMERHWADNDLERAIELRCEKERDLRRNSL
jgi:hypothetical protein